MSLIRDATVFEMTQRQTNGSSNIFKLDKTLFNFVSSKQTRVVFANTVPVATPVLVKISFEDFTDLKGVGYKKL